LYDLPNNRGISVKKKKKDQKKNQRTARKNTETKSKIWNRGTIFGLISILIIGMCSYGAHYYIMNSSLFKIKSIDIEKRGIVDIRDTENNLKEFFIGRNIFNIDLAGIPVMLTRKYPYLKKVEARRVLPDKLNILIVPREPMAVIDSSTPVVIDKERVVLKSGIIPRSMVRIKGISFFLRTPRPGQKVDARGLDETLGLLQLLKDKNMVKKYGIKYIDVADKRNYIVDIQNVVVKFGDGSFPSKVSKLEEILDDPSVKLKEIKYIDLRFEEAVIAPR
jgi:cell division septal protein FtsQ